MQITTTPIEGLLVVQPKVFGDHRGYFMETYNEGAFRAAGLPTDFVQDNQSFSGKGILRGLHFQAPPYEQGKLVRVIRGAVLDVALDLRTSSATYGQHFAIRLTEENKTMVWIPAGFAHGFLTLEDDTLFAYKVTGLYNKESEGGILWNDPDIGIEWGIDQPVLSDKDLILPRLADFNSPF